MDPQINFINNAYIYQKFYDFLSLFSQNPDALIAKLLAFFDVIKPLSVLLSLLFLTGIIYCTIRIRVVIAEAKEKAGGHGHGEFAEGGEAVHEESHTAEPAVVVNPRWEKIMEHVNSGNPSDWRLAILECDIVLHEMLTKMSYHGETLSDKLKAVERSDFLTIDKAWEAHRVRNAIAHEGSNFQISDRETKRVVGLYEEVFREFHYI